MRFATEPIYSHSNQLDGIVALDNETIVLHQNQLKENGFILCDSKLSAEDPRLIKVADPASEYNGEGEYLRYRYSENGITPRLIPGKSKHLVSIDSDEYDERGWITESAEVRTQMMDKRMKKIERLKQELLEPDFIGPDDFDTLLLGLHLGADCRSRSIIE